MLSTMKSSTKSTALNVVSAVPKAATGCAVNARGRMGRPSSVNGLSYFRLCM